MIVDSSALIALLLREPEASAVSKAMDEADWIAMSAASYVEVSIVLSSRHHAAALGLFDSILMESDVQIEPVTTRQAHLARLAFLKYGKGRHKAGLNFGDCFSYALAKDMGEPLLYKGGDFAKTDIEKVEY